MITAAAPPLMAHITTGRTSLLERAAYVALLGFAAAPQFSIAASGILLGLATILWLAVVVVNHERIEVPDMFWPLAAYAGATLVASLFSVDPAASFRDCKQLVLFAIIPIAYRLFHGERTLKVVDVIITVGALNAVYGIVQYAILNFDNIENRIQGNLGHYMTYSGVIMLVACIAFARVMFRRRDRLWAALVLPAVLVALILTLSRNAWVGACAGIGSLLLLKNVRQALRFAAILPIALGLFVAFAPALVSERILSMTSLQDRFKQTTEGRMTTASNRDRLAMLKMGALMVRDHPITGVGPDAVVRVYAGYRSQVRGAVSQLNSHLHNVPLQIAAERGLPALAIWIWFVVTLLRDFLRKRKTSAVPSLATAGIACVVAMLAAGQFEYNFGDSEFLMLFLVVITLPYAADRQPPMGAERHPAAARASNAA
jgi:O-antigen ligase